MSSANPPTVTDVDADNIPLPRYLARHLDLGFTSDDVAALLRSIDSSQKPQTSSTPHLPAELLLQILEYVPVDYVLDWRLICRGFRDAIDGRVLYHHLHRTELIGYMGARHQNTGALGRLDDEQYDRIHLLRAHFRQMGKSSEDTASAQRSGPVWSGTHAFFQIEDEWFESFRQVGGAAARGGDTIQDADTQWMEAFHRLELHMPDGFGMLRWCIKLDHAVLDLDRYKLPVPLTRENSTPPVYKLRRNAFDVHVHLDKRTIKVAWRDMLIRFLKTETALRRMTKHKQDSAFTFSHGEDCLRAVRRQRLQSSLNPDDKVDRHRQWSLRLLPPLFGKPRHDHRVPLEDDENDATTLLLLLRREAAMTSRQIAYLRQLAFDYNAMDTELHALEQAFQEFKGHLAMPGFQLSISLPGLNPRRLPRNPISWPDDLRAKVEEQVAKWKSQQQVVEQMKALLSASNMALTLPEDSFENLDSDF